MEVRVEDMSFGYGDLPVLHHIDLVLDRPGLVLSLIHISEPTRPY